MFERASAILEVFAGLFSFPTSLAFDEQGTLYLAESGLPFGGAMKGGRIWRLDSQGRARWLSNGYASRSLA